MTLTVIQTQVLSSHLAALGHSLSQRQPSDEAPKFTPNQVLSSLVLELGPTALPMICESINTNAIELKQFTTTQLQCICDLCEECICELDNCIASDIPPGRIFQGLIARLIKELWPMFIQIFIDFLQENKPTQRSLFKI